MKYRVMLQKQETELSQLQNLCEQVRGEVSVNERGPGEAVSGEGAV